jgi:hypothetical protein
MSAHKQAPVPTITAPWDTTATPSSENARVRSVALFATPWESAPLGAGLTARTLRVRNPEGERSDRWVRVVLDASAHFTGTLDTHETSHQMQGHVDARGDPGAGE